MLGKAVASNLATSIFLYFSLSVERFKKKLKFIMVQLKNLLCYEL